jgi:hypothetical protein
MGGGRWEHIEVERLAPRRKQRWLGVNGNGARADLGGKSKKTNRTVTVPQEDMGYTPQQSWAAQQAKTATKEGGSQEEETPEERDQRGQRSGKATRKDIRRKRSTGSGHRSTERDRQGREREQGGALDKGDYVGLQGRMRG